MGSPQRMGTIVLIAGGVAFLVAITFFDYYTVGGKIKEPTLWHLATRYPVVLTVVAASAIALAASSFLRNAPILSVLATCLSFYLFGQFFPTGLRVYNGLGAGFWLATSATVAMSIGGVLAVAGRRDSDVPSAAR